MSLAPSTPWLLGVDWTVTAIDGASLVETASLAASIQSDVVKSVSFSGLGNVCVGA